MDLDLAVAEVLTRLIMVTSIHTTLILLSLLLII